MNAFAHGMQKRQHLRRADLPLVFDDRGASAVLVAFLLIALLAFGAFVLDVGLTGDERRDLQNGADAAALGIALDCARDGVCSAADAQPEAEMLASANSDDGEATVRAADIAFDLHESTVTVTAWTRDAVDGDGEINYVLAPVIGVDGKAVQATAVARWQALSGGVTTEVPITFGLCEFNIAIGGNPAQNSSEWPPELQESKNITIFFHTGEGNTGPTVDDDEWSYDDQKECYGVAGSDATEEEGALPGGFGWLQQVKPKSCSAYVDDEGWIQAEPGNGVPNGCDPNPDWKGTEFTVPVFDKISFGSGGPCGSNKCYHVIGFATFEITGFRFPGESYGNACKAPLTCLSGNFIKYSVLGDYSGGGGDGGGADLGTTVVTLAG